MDKIELLFLWNDAMSNGTFLTNKHDPSSVVLPARAIGLSL